MRWIICFLLLQLSVGFLNAQVYNRTIGRGEFIDVTISTSSQTTNKGGVSTLDGLGYMPNLAAASRLLAQASLGSDFETITAASELGYSAWIDQQLNMPVDFTLLAYCENIIDRYSTYLAQTDQDTTDIFGDDSNWVNNYFLFSWWKYVMDSEDLLRARVALALSEIVVISAIPDFTSQPLGLSDYYDILIRNAFGNYKDLLQEVTYHPLMGRYLTFMNNRKSNLDRNRFPDENYAREIMQLFTIGLYELNIDGTHKLDDEGNSIATYENDDIKELAKVFTGLSWGDRDEFGHSGSFVKYYSSTIPMKMFNEEHEPGEKILLGKYTIPDRNPVDGDADIQDALDFLFNHPNVGPFLARKLIQRLVTSNPSPQYIARVAEVFNDNGAGVRGDLKEMVRAILLDPEARDCATTQLSGKLKEPIHRHVQFLRSFNASSQSGEYRYTTGESYREATDQRVLHSPSVFNFFLPDYQPIGEIADAGLVAPEFQILHSSTIIGYANAIMKWTFENNLVGTTRLFPDEPITDEEAKLNLNLDDELELMADGRYEELVERLNLVLMNGQMSINTRQILLDTLDVLKDEEDEFKLNMMLFLSMIAPEYLVVQ